MLAVLAVALNLESRAPAATTKPTVQEIVARLLDADPWGLGGTILSARATLKDKQGATSELSFSARSRRYSPPFSKTLVRFTAPADIAGAGFLQIQNREGDDERFLFLPELKRSRRISGNLRGSSFMGTDFSFADLDRRDLAREQFRRDGRRRYRESPVLSRRFQADPRRIRRTRTSRRGYAWTTISR